MGGRDWRFGTVPGVLAQPPLEIGGQVVVLHELVEVVHVLTKLSAHLLVLSSGFEPALIRTRIQVYGHLHVQMCRPVKLF